MVRVYCSQGRIPNAYSEFDTWYIPADAEKPARKPKEVKPTPLLLQKIIKQRDGKQYRGFYEYLQINMVYSSGRMASNRLTRNHVEVLYKKDWIFTTSEDIKVNDIVEARNHFLCVDTILTNAMKPLTQTFINQLQGQFLSDSCKHRRHAPTPVGYRKTPASKKFGKTTPPAKISAAMADLIEKYETKKSVDLEDILDFHVKFECIRPYEDCIELAEQYKVDFHHNFVLNFVTKVNCVRALDYPKIAVCTDTGCACYSLKSYSFPKPLSHFSPVYSTLLLVELKHMLGKEAQKFGRKSIETYIRRMLHPVG